MITGFGVGVPWQVHEGDMDKALDMLFVLGSPDWHDWQWYRRNILYPRYTPEVYDLEQDGFAMAAMEESNVGPPGHWRLGNEPNNKEQSNDDPKVAARFSLFWRTYAKGTFGLPGLLIMEPDYMHALDWLQAYLDADGVIPHEWTVNCYAWTPEQWDNCFHPFLDLCARLGIERPVSVRECACYDPALDKQKALMTHIHMRLNQGFVDSAYWYSVYDPFGPFRAADLLTATGQLTPLGVHFVALRGSPPPQPEPSGMMPQAHLPFVVREAM